MKRRFEFRVFFIALLACYLIALNVLVTIAVAKTDLVAKISYKAQQVSGIEFSPTPITPPDGFIEILHGVYKQMDSSVPSEATIFLGDSITMALAAAAVTQRPINYGIGYQRSDQLLDAIKDYEAINRAAAVVVTTGTNDLLQGTEEGIEHRYSDILKTIPPTIPVILTSVPPLSPAVLNYRKIDKKTVKSVVNAGRMACAADPRCIFVNLYSLLTIDDLPAAGVLLDDGVHLSSRGYQLWIAALLDEIRKLGDERPNSSLEPL